jgi:thioredoxin-like negative regulator of GroEL
MMRHLKISNRRSRKQDFFLLIPGQTCKALTPILEELDKKYTANPDIKFLKVNTQEYQQFAMDNEIHAIPCVLIFFDGEPAKYEVENPRTGDTKTVDRLIGLRPAEHYEDAISYFLGDK